MHRHLREEGEETSDTLNSPGQTTPSRYTLLGPSVQKTPLTTLPQEEPNLDQYYQQNCHSNRKVFTYTVQQDVTSHMWPVSNCMPEDTLPECELYI